MPETQTQQKITKDMTIGEIVQTYPSVVEILLNEGVHCVGCGAAYYETLGEGLLGHGHNKEEINTIIKKLNLAIPNEEGDPDKIIITDHATKKLKELLEAQNKQGSGLRIRVLPGGCAGFQYALNFEKNSVEDDQIIEVNNVKFIIDNESMTHLKGAKVDYVDGLQGAGFKISNPNAKKTCGCGQSFR